MLVLGFREDDAVADFDRIDVTYLLHAVRLGGFVASVSPDRSGRAAAVANPKALPPTRNEDLNRLRRGIKAVRYVPSA